jgi:hypothetical protein
MSDEDLAYIGAAVLYLADLAIPLPALEIAVLETCFLPDATRQLEHLADILKTYPCLKYLQLVVDSTHRNFDDDEGLPAGHMLPEEKAARKAVEALSNRGLCLEFFTLAMRFPEHDYVWSASETHLRVRPDPKLSETISAKALERDMDMYGDLKMCNFEELVKEEAGFMCDYER